MLGMIRWVGTQVYQIKFYLNDVLCGKFVKYKILWSVDVCKNIPFVFYYVTLIYTEKGFSS